MALWNHLSVEGRVTRPNAIHKCGRERSSEPAPAKHTLPHTHHIEVDPPSTLHTTMINLAVLKAQEVLVRYADSFHRDFDFDDVLDDVRRYVLSDAECSQILAHRADPTQQIEQLIFVLSTSAHRLSDFINAIEEKYDWLAQRMRSALDDAARDAELVEMLQQIQELRSQIPRLEAINVQRKYYVSHIYCESRF